MKVVLTGATGFVGSQVLSALLARADVEAVTALTRRPLAVKHAKLNVVEHADFGAYGADVRAQIAECSACIWALGGKASEASSPADYERTTHGITLAFANAVAAPRRLFRFCYLSGMGADPTESARLPWERETRRLKGRTERDLGSLEARCAGFEAYFFRPGGILPGRSLVEVALAPLVVRVGVLAQAMMRVAQEGAARRVVTNAEIKRIGARARS